MYRHFASEASLREAVIERWLRAIEPELATLPTRGGADTQLRAWVQALAAKSTRQKQDPELFVAYALLGDEQQGAVVRHQQALADQLQA